MTLIMTFHLKSSFFCSVACIYFELVLLLFQNRNSSVKVDLPKVRVLDGEELSPLSVRFPNGSTITGSPTGINPPLTCRLSFRSSKSVSLFTDVHFGSEKSNW